ncbi:unnamed protein product [Lymnaea stagnalis]|uniref:Evolutionarily conserved signaling intermediate in Toll pathway, mitochondrial n=1 Tax=Lymnaea stagnalis TaxID=6523 RepID=A0AAV2IP72_LYMST
MFIEGYKMLKLCFKKCGALCINDALLASIKIVADTPVQPVAWNTWNDKRKQLSFSYCQSRFYQVRRLHVSAIINNLKDKKQSDPIIINKKPEDVMVQSGNEESVTETERTTSSAVGKPQIFKQAQLSQPLVRPSSLPDHDPKRITEESRKLERKARAVFDKIATEKGASKPTFIYAINEYISKDTLYRRGALEFIYAGLSEMKRFGVNRDLTAYKALIQCFPEEKMIPRNVWQVEFMHYPRQQQCGIDLMEQMEQSAVIPDDEFGVLLKNRFGSTAHVTRKYRRMMYWLPKFKNMNPYPVPYDMPNDPIELALLMLKRMCVDEKTKYNVIKTVEMEDSPEEDTFIVSAQSPTQQQLISQHKTGQPLFVEGPFPVYMRYVGKRYFLLRGEPNINSLMKQKKLEEEEEKEENLFEWVNFYEENYKEIKPVLSVHEQEDSTILGLCITGTSTKSSVVAWIRWLEKSNPNLAQTPVLFKLISPNSETDVIGDNRPFTELKKL